MPIYKLYKTDVGYIKKCVKSNRYLCEYVIWVKNGYIDMIYTRYRC